MYNNTIYAKSQYRNIQYPVPTSISSSPTENKTPTERLIEYNIIQKKRLLRGHHNNRTHMSDVNKRRDCRIRTASSVLIFTVSAKIRPSGCPRNFEERRDCPPGPRPSAVYQISAVNPVTSNPAARRRRIVKRTTVKGRRRG